MSEGSRTEGLFFAALEKTTAAERAAFLDQACAGDESLHRRVERLLASHSQAGTFLERPVAEAANLAALAPPQEGSGGGPRSTSGSAPTGRPEDGVRLDFLAPSQRPDALGRLGHYEMPRGRRPGRDGDRAEGIRRETATRRRHQGAGPGAGGQRSGAGAVCARGPGHRRDLSRQRDRHPCRRRLRSRALPRHAVHRWPHASAEGRPARARCRSRRSCASACRLLPDWPPPTPRAWSIGMSSRPTFSWRTASSG